MMKKVILWTHGIDNILLNKGSAFGLQLQLSFWAKAFRHVGWGVYSFSSDKCVKEIEGITFMPWQKLKWIEILHEYIITYRVIRRVEPDLIIRRGAGRDLYSLSRICKRKGVKLLFSGASDSDFQPQNEIIAGLAFYKKMYQRALKNVDYFMTQNIAQHDDLKRNYNKDSIIIPNIWGAKKIGLSKENVIDIIWVAHVRPFKRPEWLYRLARRMPNNSFRMVGNGTQLEDLKENGYNVSFLPNIVYNGPCAFEETTRQIGESRILVCTSEFEGFPNVFLQALEQNVPIVSTVNPNEVLTREHIGIYVKTEDELFEAVSRVLEDKELYHQIQMRINEYFTKTHNPETALQNLLVYLGY